MPSPITCLGKTFATDDERRSSFRDELRKQLPELRKIEGFPIGADDDIFPRSHALRGNAVVARCATRQKSVRP